MADLVTGEGAVYNGLSHTLRHTYIYPHLIHIEPPPPLPVTWPAGSYIHVVMSGGHWGPLGATGGRYCSQTEHEVCLRGLSISPGQLNCAGHFTSSSPARKFIIHKPGDPAGWECGKLKTHQIFLVASFT